MRLIFAIFALLLSSGSAAQVMPLPNKVTSPQDNPQSAAKIELGKKLYFDPRISVDGTISCNSCHNVMGSGEDNRPNSVGVAGQKGGRTAPTVWNSAFMSVMFWDGRMNSLEDQAKGPMTNPIEMGMASHDLVVMRISQIPGYVAEFKKVYGKDTAINIDLTAKAIAAFERTLITPNSPVDKYLRGDKKALNEEQKKGLALFNDVGCVACHSGPNFAGPALPQGVGFFQKFPTFEDNDYVKKYNFKADNGRFDVTKQEVDRNMWRVPTLRNIAITAPYFHNGAVATLDEAVRVMAKVQLNRDLKEDEALALVAFLKGNTGEFPSVVAPRLPMTEGSTVLSGSLDVPTTKQ